MVINTDNLINTTYHGAIVGGISIVYSMLANKLLKIKPADLGKLDLNDSLKVTATVGSALATENWLITQGILPDKIIKPSS